MYSKTPSGKSSKGSVGIENFQGRLRLRLPRQLFEGKQKYLTLGLADNSENRKEAEKRARTIELDILSDNFDPTLKKYQPKTYLTVVEPIKQKQEPNLNDLWEKYCQIKKTSCAPGTWKNGYLVMTRHLNRCFAEKSSDLDNSASIYDWAVSNLTPDTAKRFLTQLSACCNWGIRSKLCNDNPFEGLQGEIKVKKTSTEDNDINPFSKEERDAIITAFEANCYYKHYANYVKFLFLTGARPSEVIALQWKHISDKSISFEQAVVAGSEGLVLKAGLKTQDKRKFPINTQLSNLLNTVKALSDTFDLNAFVFPSPDGKWIDIHNFRNRAWKVILNSLDIEYRKPYQTRHTFITMSLEAGVSIPQISKWVGNSPKIIMENYAGTLAQVTVPQL